MRFSCPDIRNKDGCLICLFLLNRFGKKFMMLPHLQFTGHNNFHYFPSRNSNFCPSLLRINQASRLELVNEITGLCAGCLKRRGADVCYHCNGKNNVSCKTSQKHPHLCACAHCVTYTTNRIKTYNGLLAEGPDIVKKLQLDQSDHDSNVSDHDSNVSDHDCNASEHDSGVSDHDPSVSDHDSDVSDHDSDVSGHTQHTHLSYEMMAAINPEETKATKNDVESGFNAVLDVNVTKNCKEVTYAKVTSVNCFNNGTKEQTTKNKIIV